MREQTATRARWALAFGMGIAGLLGGCGGDLTAGIQGSGAPVASSVTTVGPIQAFGSIFVDGVEYSTGGAQIRIDDQSGTESQLRVGHIVTIKGTINADGLTGTATEVSFIGDLRGPVTQLDVAGGTFKVLGQTVRANDATLFDESFTVADLSGLQNGTVVEVSGFPTAAGVVSASRVESGNAANGFQIRGTVQALDTAASTFRINSLTIDYSGVAPVGTLANAAIVTVQGNTIAPSGALVATRVQVFPGLGAAANDRGRLEGVITSFVSNTDFTVNGQRVLTDGSTDLNLQGVTLGVDVPVKVRGTFNAAGALVASRVDVKPQSLSLVRGLVDSASASSSTLTVLGVPITTSGTTSFNDKSSLHLRPFRLADVRSGDYVEVRGVANSSGGGLSATLVERDKPEDRSYLQGVALNVASPNFTVLGVPVSTDSQTSFPGSGGQDAAARFFSEAQGQLVKVRGTLAGNTLLAEQAQIRH